MTGGSIMTTGKSEEKCFNKLPQDIQEALKKVAREKEIHHVDAFVAAIDAGPSLPVLDACHRYIENHRASCQ